MGIITKFTKANIKSAKTNSFVLIFSVAICSIIFILSLIIPYYMRAETVKLARGVYGSADFYLMPSSNEQRFASTKIIPDKLRNECEYIYGFFIFSNNFIVNNVSENYTVIGVDYDELNNFNAPNLTSRVDALNEGEILISSITAEKWNANVGDLFVVEATGGYKYPVKVVGISADDSSIFALNNPIVVSKEFMKKLSAGVYNDGMFNLLVVKLHNKSDVTETAREFTELYENFSGSLSKKPLFASLPKNFEPKNKTGTSSPSCIVAATGFLSAENSFLSFGSFDAIIITAGTTSAFPKKSQVMLAPSPISPILAKVFATLFATFCIPLKSGPHCLYVEFCTFIAWQYSKTCKK